MGVVYEATQLSLERTVALKLISAELGSDPAFRERFRREGMIQAGVDHPHIVPVYEAGESEHGLFIAMRLIRGRNLKDLIGGGELTPARTVHLLSQVAEALDTAHEVGLIHRDIKPYNILVDDRRDHAYLADFGVTKARSRPNLTKTGQMVGTLDYMAPEQIRGQTATEQTDVYALGCVLYECFTGTVPFYRETDAAVLYAHLSEPLPSVREHSADLPAALDTVLGKAMAKKPEDRYETATSALRDVSVAVAAGRAAATAPPAPAQPTEPPAGTVLQPGPDGSPTAAPAPAQETDLPVAPGTVLAAGAAGAAGTAAAEAAATERRRAGDGARRRDAGARRAADRRGRAAWGAGDRARGRGCNASRRCPGRPERRGGCAANRDRPGRHEDRSHRGAGRRCRRGADATAQDAAAAPAAPGRPRTALFVIGGVALLAVALAVVGFLVLGGGGDDDQPTTPISGGGTATAGRVTLSYPSDWQKLATTPRIPGLNLANEMGLGPKGAQGAGLLTGTTPAAWPTFVPATFRSRIPGSALTDRDTVRIGGLDAFRYSDLKPKGFDGTVTLFVVPQEGKPTTALACFAKTGQAGAGGGVFSDCSAIAAGIAINGATSYPLTLPSDYATRLNSTLTRLTSSRESGVTRMANAGSSSTQATAARSVASAYGAAIPKLQSANATAYIEPANDEIVAALRRTQRAYTSLASAAAAESTSRYDSARRRVNAGEQRLRTAVVDLEALGFDVSG